jgi:hypothetical protein
MKWPAIVELTGRDGVACSHEVNRGGSNTIETSALTVGLALVDGKRTLAGVQDHLVGGFSSRDEPTLQLS